MHPGLKSDEQGMVKLCVSASSAASVLSLGSRDLPCKVLAQRASMSSG